MSEYLLVFIALNIPPFAIWGVPALITMASRKRLNKSVPVNRIRHKAGVLRGELFKLVVEKKLSPDSLTFLSLYSLLTFIVRNPDRFSGVADEVCSGLFGREEDEELDPDISLVLDQEAKTWPKEMKPIATRMAAILVEIAWWRYRELIANHKMRIMYLAVQRGKTFCWRYASTLAKKIARSDLWATTRSYLLQDMLNDNANKRLYRASACLTAACLCTVSKD